jgi:hypothetical protein
VDLIWLVYCDSFKMTRAVWVYFYIPPKADPTEVYIFSYSERIPAGKKRIRSYKDEFLKSLKSMKFKE